MCNDFHHVKYHMKNCWNMQNRDIISQLICFSCSTDIQMVHNEDLWDEGEEECKWRRVDHAAAAAVL